MENCERSQSHGSQEWTGGTPLHRSNIIYDAIRTVHFGDHSCQEGISAMSKAPHYNGCNSNAQAYAFPNPTTAYTVSRPYVVNNVPGCTPRNSQSQDFGAKKYRQYFGNNVDIAYNAPTMDEGFWTRPTNFYPMMLSQQNAPDLHPNKLRNNAVSQKEHMTTLESQMASRSQAIPSASGHEASIKNLRSPHFAAGGFLARPEPIPRPYQTFCQSGIQPIYAPDGNIKRQNMNFRRLEISGATHSIYALSPRDADLQRHISNSLRTHGVCVIDRFLGEHSALNILKETKVLHSMRPWQRGESLGSIGSMRSVRDDVITWVDGSEPECASVGLLCRKLDGIVSVGQGVTEGYNICGSTKAMVAKYPGSGSGYQLHIDNPREDGRCLTCLYYMNKNWDSNKMGGILRLRAQTTGKTANITPMLDRIVIFYSDHRNPHEVLPTYNDRYAITLWYFDRQERKRAIERMASTSQSRK